MRRPFIALTGLIVLLLAACGGTPSYARYDAYGGYCTDSYGGYVLCPGYYYDPGLGVVVNLHTGSPVYVSRRYQSVVYGHVAAGAPNPVTLAPKGSVSVKQVKSDSGYQSAVKTQSNKSGGQTITTGGGSSGSGGGQTITTNSNKPANTSVKPAAGGCSGQNNCTGGGGAASNKAGGSSPPQNPSKPAVPNSGGPSKPSGPPPASGPPKSSGPPPAAAPSKK